MYVYVRWYTCHTYILWITVIQGDAAHTLSAPIIWISLAQCLLPSTPPTIPAHPRVLVKRRERKYKNKEKLLVSTSLIPPLVPQWSPLQIWPSRYPNTFQPPACPSLAEVSCPRSSPPTKRCFLPCSVTPLVWPPGYSSEEEEKEGRMTLHP